MSSSWITWSLVRFSFPTKEIDPIWQLCTISEGFKEAAEKFKDEAGVKNNTELRGMDNRIKIRDAIQAGRITEAISMVHQQYPELLDDDRYLFFHLQVLVFHLNGLFSCHYYPCI